MLVNPTVKPPGLRGNTVAMYKMVMGIDKIDKEEFLRPGTSITRSQIYTS